MNTYNMKSVLIKFSNYGWFVLDSLSRANFEVANSIK